MKKDVAKMLRLVFYFHMRTKPERQAKNFELCATKHFSAPCPSAYASSEKRDLNARRDVERQTFL